MYILAESSGGKKADINYYSPILYEKKYMVKLIVVV